MLGFGVRSNGVRGENVRSALIYCVCLCRSEEERNRLLLGTGVAVAVEKDLINIEEEYDSIVLPFMKSHPDTFDPRKHTLDLYKKLVAFVMAYR